MSTFRVSVLISALMLALSFPCLADQVQGYVESVNSSDNSIQVKDPVSGAGKKVHVHPKVMADIKNGSVVKATMKSGSDQADSVEVLIPR